jgi:RNA-splicing ligase RtcB
MANQTTLKDSKNEDVKIFLPKNELDDETLKLVEKFSKSEVFSNIRVMPDCHSSILCCVGLTSQIENKVIPSIVGGDIGCGISCYPLNKKIKEKQYKIIDATIKKIIPMGNQIHGKQIVDDAIMDEIYNRCNIKIEHLKENFPEYPFRDFHYTKNYFQTLISKMKSKTSSSIFLRAIGTLGGGNHYIEFNEDYDRKAYLTIHSGSRALGQAVCNYHQGKITQENKNSLNNYLQNEELVEYLIDMIFAQTVASMNRELMIKLIINEIGVEWNKDKLIETIHNYIDFKRLILRKGAIAAEAGELCIISLNMRDGILLCKGKGNPDWNYSSAHGCGRIMSRTTARNKLRMEDFKREMGDVYSTSICKNTLDEAPMAYKDVEKIKQYIGDSVKIIKQLKPFINIKGY